ncbi:branched-chain amino acid ABC transporter substrate-binding protein [Meiothermus granaticius]|uniref:Leucine-, isoleucine-, valine-, threonine-, and alanine-binding protein n=1 Tax=Meiothermus granaticius NBRC 107808 TaxID=1227551 RepID=A0A399FB13_9DEIN|nr:branched-chain amino acid ABC transporter substrate-binding protein [Meiothermus granaticius]MCL6527172.1 branched-chain amino acid ABC transporter substrate-binding protein [Thermaceae bacterium]RIH93398.1 Leucine-, isoleucine-, valine-, threonine-, and alanine-binding protein [Meiothermus granaticius NBRC 107808]GEM87647.1 branched chain amino acid ABC transporter substrate-binding protein [Meiothermus granaticius NBRC 107808]
MKKLAILATGVLALSLASAQTVIKIASVSPLSGPQSVLGESIKLGAQLAIEEAQPRFKAMGFDLQFAPQDDQATPDVGVAVARRIVNDPDLLGVVGHLNSGVAIPASEVYKDTNLVMVSPANTNPRITDRGYLNVNRVCGRDDVQGPVGAEYAVKTLKKTRLFVIHDKTAYGQGLAEAFANRAKELGATVVSFVGTEEASNFQPLILQMRAQKPDLVYYGGIYDKGGVLIKQMRERGLAMPVMGGDGLDSSELVKIAGKAVIGTLYTTTSGPIDTLPKAAAFAKNYKAKFGKDSEAYGAYAYDATNVILAGLEAAIKANGGKKPTREEVAKAVRQVKLDGITGRIEFDDKGDRKLSDYYVIYMKTDSYPGVVQKIIQFAPPKKG